jgi:predicted transposase/invertase (TIGR01784 family)
MRLLAGLRLKGYSFFVSLLREYGKTMELGAAADRAVKECLRKNVLKEFLEEHGSEIVNMLDWDDEDAAEYYRKEGRAIGRAEGVAIGEAKGKEEDAKAMLAEGMNVALIAKITGLGKDEIEGLR